MPIHFDSLDRLSRFYVFSNPALKVYDNVVIPSLQFMYWFIRILQMESDPSYQGPSALEFAQDESLARYPKTITSWLLEHEVDVWYGITDTFSMFVNIVYHIALKNRVFRNELEQSNLDGQVNYLYCDVDKVYGIGISSKELAVGDEPTGVNGWGKVLQTVADCLSSNVVPSSYREFESNYVSIPPNPTPPMNHQLKSVLVLTDNYGCNITSIAKGHCVVGNGGFDEIVDRCVEDNINLSEYEFIIIAVGNNEICRTTENRDLAWGKFEQFMGPEIERRSADESTSTILVSYPLPVQKINGMFTFYNWLTSKIEPWNVSALNWRHKQCPLFRDDGRMKMGLFCEYDAFMLKRVGVRRLWKCWVDHFNELTFVGVKIK